MKEENKFLKIIVAILIILNIFISFKSLKLAIDYEALKIEKEDLETLTKIQSSIMADQEETNRKLNNMLEEE